MVDSTASEAFIGRFSISYKDGKNVYAFDEITYGLYRISLELKKVDMVVYPADIVRSTGNRIVGISKKGNEIILIPIFLDLDWIFYDTKGRKIRYESVAENRIEIWGVVTIESNLFLVPAYPMDPIVIFSLNDMKITKIYKDWHEKNTDRITNTYIWGSFAYGNTVFLPIVNSREIVSVNYDGVGIITLDIPYSIYSVCADGDRIWILPVFGEYLYMADFKGKIIGRVNMSEINPRISADKFYRIVAIRGNIFLLPMYGENIFIYRCENKQIVQIEVGEANMWARLFASLPVSYSDYVIEEGTLHLLPCDCQYKKIYIDSLENEEYILHFGDSIGRAKYWKSIWDVQKKAMIEKENKDLDDFCQLLFYLPENFRERENERIGRNIWKRLKK